MVGFELGLIDTVMVGTLLDIHEGLSVEGNTVGSTVDTEDGELDDTEDG